MADLYWKLFITALGLAWPAAVVGIILKWFPDTAGKVLLARMEHRAAERLANVKEELGRQTALQVAEATRELEARYSTLKISTDFLSASQSGMRDEIIAAVKLLWKTMMEIKTEFGVAVTFEMIFTPEEIKGAIEGTGRRQILRFVDALVDLNALQQKAIAFSGVHISVARPFCGDRLWLLFYVFQAVYVRVSFLANKSLLQKKYEGWREDTGILGHLSSVLTADEVTKAMGTHPYGLVGALGEVENLFLREATRVMSGSRAMSEHLSDTQAMMLLQTNLIAEQKARAKDLT